MPPLRSKPDTFVRRRPWFDELRPATYQGVWGGLHVGPILIVDDSLFLRSSIRSSIEQNTDWQVCGEAENGQVAIEKTRELHPDLIILDLAMPIMNGLDAARQIAGFDPGVDIVLFTMHGSRELSKYAELIGIKQVLSKSSGGIDQLLSTVRVLLDQKHALIAATAKPFRPTG